MAAIHPALPADPARPATDFWCRGADSNRRPRAYETRALDQLSYPGRGTCDGSTGIQRENLTTYRGGPVCPPAADTLVGPYDSSLRAAAINGIMISWWPTSE